jgi:hypothetical protein
MHSHDSTDLAVDLSRRPVTAEVLLYEYLVEAVQVHQDGLAKWDRRQRLFLRRIEVTNAAHAPLPAYVTHSEMDSVQVWLGGRHKKYDEHVTVKCWHRDPLKGFGRRKSRDTVLVLDGILGCQVLLDGRPVWDSRTYFPLFLTAEIYRAAATYAAQRELDRRRQGNEITAQEYLEAFKALVASANRDGRVAIPAEFPWVVVRPGESLTDYEP